MKKQLLIGLLIGLGITFGGFTTSVQAATTTTNINATQQVGTRTLSLGTNGEDVKVIQHALNIFGSYGLVEDGNFGKMTANAIIDFQNKNGLAADGIVGKNTVTILLNGDTSSNYVNATTVQGVVQNNSLSQVDQILVELGYSVDTKSAIKSFQSNNGLISDGVVGPMTHAKLIEKKYLYDLNAGKITSKTNYFIAVDKDDKKVFVYQNNNGWSLVNQFLCDIGAQGTDTIEGNFSAGIKGTQMKIGAVVVKYYTQISGNYLFHSVLYDLQGKAIVDGRLGQAISHGCVRLATQDAKYIYDTIPASTSIVII